MLSMILTVMVSPTRYALGSTTVPIYPWLIGMDPSFGYSLFNVPHCRGALSPEAAGGSGIGGRGGLAGAHAASPVNKAAIMQHPLLVILFPRTPYRARLCARTGISPSPG